MTREEKLKAKLNNALKVIDRQREINKKFFEENHRANQRIMQLEEENAYLRNLNYETD
uniref:Uncharacterized protein n=1 Tax=Siphoviridae sp. ctljn1 TaxID=2826448 RepID=A0A8S5R1H5_9CAUD|nr:MAG TPA: hypothetical protein [Siphoviridae sp. ctljn1]